MLTSYLCHIDVIEGTELQNVFEEILDSVFKNLFQNNRGNPLPTSEKMV